MRFVHRRETTAKLEIPDGAFKEAHLLLTHDIMSKVDKYNIPDSLIINIDQTLTKYVPASRSTLAKKNSKVKIPFSLLPSFTDAAHLWRKNDKIFAQIQISQ